MLRISSVVVTREMVTAREFTLYNLLTIQSTFYTVNCTLYTLHCTTSLLYSHYTTLWTLWNLHYTLYNRLTDHTFHCKLYTSHFTFHTLLTFKTTLYTVHYSLNSLRIHPPHSTVHTLRCTVVLFPRWQSPCRLPPSCVPVSRDLHGCWRHFHNSLFLMNVKIEEVPMNKCHIMRSSLFVNLLVYRHFLNNQVINRPGRSQGPLSRNLRN